VDGSVSVDMYIRIDEGILAVNTYENKQKPNALFVHG